MSLNDSAMATTEHAMSALCPVCDEGESGTFQTSSRRQAASVNVPAEPD